MFLSKFFGPARKRKQTNKQKRLHHQTDLLSGSFSITSNSELKIFRICFPPSASQVFLFLPPAKFTNTQTKKERVREEESSSLLSKNCFCESFWLNLRHIREKRREWVSSQKGQSKSLSSFDMIFKALMFGITERFKSSRNPIWMTIRILLRILCNACVCLDNDLRYSCPLSYVQKFICEN